MLYVYDILLLALLCHQRLCSWLTPLCLHYFLTCFRVHVRTGILVCSSAKVIKKGEELTFDDDEDDLIDALGFDNDKEIPKKKEAAPQKAR